jgi:glycosyltransferase involved in cell wall biosynthesis
MRRWQRHAVPIAAETLQKLGAKQLVVQRPVHVEFAGRTAMRAGIGCYWMMPNIISDRWLGINRRWYQHVCHKYRILPLPDSRYTGSTLGRDIGQQVLYYGVNDQRFDADRVKPLTRAEVGLPQEGCVMAVFARLEPTKGQHVFWEAMLSVIESGADIHLLLLGGPTDGPIAAQMRELAARHGAEHRLHFAGFTKEPERYYGVIDVAVNCRIDPEPFGLSVVEAMLMGKPVLVHALGGPAETVLDGETGWHVQQPTVAAFASGIRRVMADRSRWAEMGKAARRHALQNFSLERFGANFIRIVGQTKSSNSFS